MRKESCERVNRNPAGPGRAGSHIIRNISLRQHTAAHAHATAHTDISPPSRRQPHSPPGRVCITISAHPMFRVRCEARVSHHAPPRICTPTW